MQPVPRRLPSNHPNSLQIRALPLWLHQPLHRICPRLMCGVGLERLRARSQIPVNGCAAGQPDGNACFNGKAPPKLEWPIAATESAEEKCVGERTLACPSRSIRPASTNCPPWLDKTGVD
jgi:hypothetical protein